MTRVRTLARDAVSRTHEDWIVLSCDLYTWESVRPLLSVKL